MMSVPDLRNVDCTGDETLWVCRYWSHFQSITGWSASDAIVQANAAWEAWGDDPDCTPEEIAESDAACIREDGI